MYYCVEKGIQSKLDGGEFDKTREDPPGHGVAFHPGRAVTSTFLLSGIGRTVTSIFSVSGDSRSRRKDHVQIEAMARKRAAEKPRSNAC